MVLFRQCDVEKIAPAIGEVVLHYAEFESAVVDLENSVNQALERKHNEDKPRAGEQTLKKQLTAISAGLRELGGQGGLEGHFACRRNARSRSFSARRKRSRATIVPNILPAHIANTRPPPAATQPRIERGRSEPVEARIRTPAR